jgi:hypothetical protein
MKTARLFAAAGAALGILLPASAYAVDGYVSGTLKFWNKQGNYCPSGRDCTGARYPQSAFDSPQAVRDAQVQVLDQNWAVIGQGSSDTNGNFGIYWYRATQPTSGLILWKARQKDSRFEIVSYQSGGIYYLWTGSFSLTSGTWSGSPQNVGTFTWGSSASPNYIANLYDGAWRSWNYALGTSGWLYAYMTNVKIRAFSAPYACLTSCALPQIGELLIDSTNATLMPQSRIMHELGHYAAYVAKPIQYPLEYSYPNLCTNCSGWTYTSAEWQSAAFEEGLASFIATATMYSSANPNPTNCLSTGPCALDATNNVEASTGLWSCAQDEGRWTRSHERYLWDVYDSVDDGETISSPFWYFVSTMVTYPGGTGDHQADEPWNSSYTAIDNADGRSSGDFLYHYQNRFGTDTTLPALNNCVW